MPEAFQRLFARSDISAVQSLNTQAALGLVHPPERSQFAHLVRHFLERLFNHETASATGDGKARLVQIACITGLPPLAVAIYLWPVYHPFPGWPPHTHNSGPPPYWIQANHHLFFVMYSFVVMGLVAIFEWDLIFPDHLDVFVLGTLPISGLLRLGARITAIATLIAGFLVDANVPAILVLPLATDPPQLFALLLGHASAVALAGFFSAGLVLATQGLLLAVFGERLFRRISLLLQSCVVTGCLLLLLLFPVLSGLTSQLLESNSVGARWFPPYWFLAIFQEHLPGPSPIPPWPQLAKSGIFATLVVWALVAATYPLAHLRRVRALVQGTASGRRHRQLHLGLDRLLYSAILRSPLGRAIYVFISQTVLRVPRYRIYLAMYSGVGLALVVAAILRLSIIHGVLHAAFSAGGIRFSIGVIPFWVVAGLRSTFTSPGNQQGGWIFRAVHGRPAPFEVALRQFQAAALWSFLAAAAITIGAIAAFQMVAPADLRTPVSLASQLLTGIGICLLITDGFFLNLSAVPFTGERATEEQNLALIVLRYYTFFPFVTALFVTLEIFGEFGGARIGAELTIIVLAHLWLRKWHRSIVRLHSSQLALEEGEDDFPLKLGLRY